MVRKVLLLAFFSFLTAACTTTQTQDPTAGATPEPKTGIETGSSAGVQNAGSAVPVDD